MLLILVCLQICKYQIAHLHRLERTSFIANPALIMMSKSNSTLHKAQFIVKTNTAQRSVDYGTVYLNLVQCSVVQQRRVTYWDVGQHCWHGETISVLPLIYLLLFVSHIPLLSFSPGFRT